MTRRRGQPVFDGLWTRKRAHGSTGYNPSPSSPRAREILQVRRRLVLARRHQLAIGAKEVVLALDLHPRVPLRTHRCAPERARLRRALGRLGDRPGPRQPAVENGDLVAESVLVGLVEIDAFLDDGLAVGMERQAARVIDPWIEQV